MHRGRGSSRYGSEGVFSRRRGANTTPPRGGEPPASVKECFNPSMEYVLSSLSMGLSMCLAMMQLTVWAKQVKLRRLTDL